MNDPDVVVIGAGAAGLAATRTLIDRGLDVVALEARKRIGGRAWTEAATFGLPIDRGCAWLHSADINPWRRIATDLGFTVLEENPDWGRRIGREPLSDERWAALDRFFNDAFTAVSAAARVGHDLSVAEIVTRDSPWTPVFDAAMSWLCGVDTAEVSSLDLARYNDSGNNWPITEGYGAVVARFGEGLPIILDTPVRAVRWNGRGVAVETARGTLDAQAAIVTLPTSLLASDAVRFSPPLPLEKQEAIANLPLGVANKVFLAIDGDPFGLPPMSHVTASATTSRTISLQFRPFGQPIVVGYLGGSLAVELEAAGHDAMVDFALGELVSLFGGSVRGRVMKASCTGWYRDPWSGGSYSSARPGHAHRRADLAAPLGGKLLFAGEACSIDSFSTCHGAYLTGIAAGNAVADRLASRHT